MEVTAGAPASRRAPSSRRARFRALGFLVVSLLALAVPAPVRAQAFLDSYKAGVEAVAAGNFPRAEKLLRQAIQGRGDEASHLIRYLHFRPYLPYAYLGFALAGEGDCAGALAAWDESRRQGVIDTLPDERARLEASRKQCAERLARATEVAEKVREVRAAIDLADQTRSELAAYASDPDLAPVWDQGELSLASRLAEADREIDRARQALADVPPGTLSPSDFDHAGDLARGAGAKLQVLRKAVALRLQSAAESKEDLRRVLETLRRRARQELDSTSSLAPYPPGLAQRRADLQAAIDASSAPELSLPDLKELRARLESGLSRLQAAAAPPPDPLIEAAAAWLRGDPEAVLATLHDVELQDARARAHAHLLKAAARFELYRAGGSKSAHLLAAARSDVLDCRRADPSVVPLPKAFPPPFVRFFENPGPPDATARPAGGAPSTAPP